jgi:hypothetical protein
MHVPLEAGYREPVGLSKRASKLQRAYDLLRICSRGLQFYKATSLFEACPVEPWICLATGYRDVANDLCE